MDAEVSASNQGRLLAIRTSMRTSIMKKYKYKHTDIEVKIECV